MFRREEFKNKRACVLGTGRSGIHCANLLALNQFKVLLSEEKDYSLIKKSPAAAKALSLLKPEVVLETGGHSEEVFSCGFAVKSPGMLPGSEIMVRLKKAGIPVFSEMEVALSFCAGARVFAVTGTNGKTTTTALLGDILKKAARSAGGSKNAHIAGNIGTAVSCVAPHVSRGDDIAVEVSSYQLEDSTYFRPDCACLLNITPDHLDHHGGMSNYVLAKTKVFSDQTAEDFCVFNASDPDCMRLSGKCPSRRLFFSTVAVPSVKLNAFPEEEGIAFELGGRKDVIPAPALPGEHNLHNAMAAGLMAASMGIAAEDIRAAFAGFRGVEHRLENAGTARGIRCINDSKATNVDSTLVALKALEAEGKKIWLILGGLDKGSPYSPLKPLLSGCVKSVLTIGQAAEKIESELRDTVRVINSATLENAVSEAVRRASAGDILLFSPACASFDQFLDYEDRGRAFKKIVRESAEGKQR